jgi:hypothetical protein
VLANVAEVPLGSHLGALLLSRNGMCENASYSFISLTNVRVKFPLNANLIFYKIIFKVNITVHQLDFYMLLRAE